MCSEVTFLAFLDIKFCRVYLQKICPVCDLSFLKIQMVAGKYVVENMFIFLNRGGSEFRKNSFGVSVKPIKTYKFVFKEPIKTYIFLLQPIFSAYIFFKTDFEA